MSKFNVETCPSNQDKYANGRHSWAEIFNTKISSIAVCQACGLLRIDNEWGGKPSIYYIPWEMRNRG